MTLNKKLLITLCCLTAILCALVGGTLAWLLDDTAPIMNTFVPSKIQVELTETYNTDANDDSVNDQWIGKLIPGTMLGKDAKVEVDNDIDCYVFVKVEKTANLDTFIDWQIAAGWTPLAGYENVYYREVGANDGLKQFYVVKDSTVYVKNTVGKAEMDTLTAPELYPKLTFTAYAAQKEGLTVTQAWQAISGN